MAQLIGKDVTLGYEGNVVIEHLNFSVQAGDYLYIVGENGSGKSTLMKAILGLKSPMAGTITTGDGLQPDEIGYLPQQTRAQRDFPATVLEVVLSGCLNRRGLHFLYTPAQRSEAMMNLGKLGILELKDACYRDLSGGQQQRVAIARALALHPDILCFDEPTSALDPELTGEVLRVLRELADRKTTMIIVTHEMHFARDVADRILFMDGGVVVEEGPAKQLIDHPREQRTKQFLAHYAE